MGGIAFGEKYSDLDGREWEVVAVDMAVDNKVTVQPAGGGEKQEVPLQQFRSEFTYVHPDGLPGGNPVADAAQAGYRSSDGDA
jgi:hypothetical protein